MVQREIDRGVAAGVEDYGSAGFSEVNTGTGYVFEENGVEPSFRANYIRQISANHPPLEINRRGYLLFSRQPHPYDLNYIALPHRAGIAAYSTAMIEATESGRPKT